MCQWRTADVPIRAGCLRLPKRPQEMAAFAASGDRSSATPAFGSASVAGSLSRSVRKSILMSRWWLSEMPSTSCSTALHYSSVRGFSPLTFQPAMDSVAVDFQEAVRFSSALPISPLSAVYFARLAFRRFHRPSRQLRCQRCWPRSLPRRSCLAVQRRRWPTASRPARA